MVASVPRVKGRPLVEYLYDDRRGVALDTRRVSHVLAIARRRNHASCARDSSRCSFTPVTKRPRTCRSGSEDRRRASLHETRHQHQNVGPDEARRRAHGVLLHGKQQRSARRPPGSLARRHVSEVFRNRLRQRRSMPIRVKTVMLLRGAGARACQSVRRPTASEIG